MSNRTDPRVLIGKHVLISVGEPWNFSSQDGENKLKGRMSGLVVTSDGAAVILIETTNFNYDGSTISQILCSGRYDRGRKLLDELLEIGKIVSCNMHFNKSGEVVVESDILSIPIGYSEWAGFLIGSVTLVD